MFLSATKTSCFTREDGLSADIFCGNQTCRSTLKDRRSLGVLLATKTGFLSQDYWTISRHLLWCPKPVVLRGKMDNQPALFHEKSDHLQVCHVETKTPCFTLEDRRSIDFYWRPKPFFYHKIIGPSPDIFCSNQNWSPEVGPSPDVFCGDQNRLFYMGQWTISRCFIGDQNRLLIARLLKHLRTSFAITKTGHQKSDHLQTSHVATKTCCFTLKDRRLATKTVFLSQDYWTISRCLLHQKLDHLAVFSSATKMGPLRQTVLFSNPLYNQTDKRAMQTLDWHMF